MRHLSITLSLLAAALLSTSATAEPAKPEAKSNTKPEAARESIDIASPPAAEMPPAKNAAMPAPIKAPDIPQAPKIVMPKDMPTAPKPDLDSTVIGVPVKGLTKGVDEASFLAAAKKAFADRDENGDGVISKSDMPKPSAPPAGFTPPAPPKVTMPEAFNAPAPPKVIVPEPPPAPPAPAPAKPTE